MVLGFGDFVREFSGREKRAFGVSEMGWGFGFFDFLDFFMWVGFGVNFWSTSWAFEG